MKAMQTNIASLFSANFTQLFLQAEEAFRSNPQITTFRSMLSVDNFFVAFEWLRDPTPLDISPDTPQWVAECQQRLQTLLEKAAKDGAKSPDYVAAESKLQDRVHIQPLISGTACKGQSTYS